MTTNKQNLSRRGVNFVKQKINAIRREQYIKKHKLPIDGNAFDVEEDINEYKKYVNFEDQHYKIRIKKD